MRVCFVRYARSRAWPAMLLGLLACLLVELNCCWAWRQVARHVYLYDKHRDVSIRSFAPHRQRLWPSFSPGQWAGAHTGVI